MDIRLVKVTPQMAQKMLGQNKNNRNVNRRRVLQYAQLMREGRWKLNGDTVLFTKSGELVDGQHRLLAVVESQVATQMIVVEGAEEDARYTKDRNRIRSLPSNYKIAGIAPAKPLAGAISYILAFNQDFPLTHSCAIEHLEAIDFYENHKEIVNEIYSRMVGYKSDIPNLIPDALVIATIFYVKQYDEEANLYIYDFFRDLLEGTETNPSNTPYLLRRRIMESKMSRTKKLTRRALCEMLLHGIRSYKEGKSLMKLSMPVANPFRTLRTGGWKKLDRGASK